MKKKLLIDTMLFNVEPKKVNESIENSTNGKLIVTGPVQKANQKNQNGRVYPKIILEREILKYKNTFIKEHRALGELDHPESSVVSLGNTSHNVLDAWWEGETVMAKIEILTTPAGNILKELLKNGIRLGISSRGLGSVKEGKNGSEVQEDFELICWDFVSNPSTHGAFMSESINSSAVNESINNYIINKENKKLKKVNNLINEILSDFNVSCNSNHCSIIK